MPQSRAESLVSQLDVISDMGQLRLRSLDNLFDQYPQFNEVMSEQQSGGNRSEQVYKRHVAEHVKTQRANLYQQYRELLEVLFEFVEAFDSQHKHLLLLHLQPSPQLVQKFLGKNRQSGINSYKDLLSKDSRQSFPTKITPDTVEDWKDQTLARSVGLQTLDYIDILCCEVDEMIDAHSAYSLTKKQAQEKSGLIGGVIANTDQARQLEHPKESVSEQTTHAEIAKNVTLGNSNLTDEYTFIDMPPHPDSSSSSSQSPLLPRKLKRTRQEETRKNTARTTSQDNKKLRITPHANTQGMMVVGCRNIQQLYRGIITFFRFFCKSDAPEDSDEPIPTPEGTEQLNMILGTKKLSFDTALERVVALTKKYFARYKTYTINDQDLFRLTTKVRCHHINMAFSFRRLFAFCFQTLSSSMSLLCQCDSVILYKPMTTLHSPLVLTDSAR